MKKNACNSVICCLQTVLLFLLPISCTQSFNITGKWQEPGKKSAIEFRQDGIFTAVDDMGMTVTGNYTFLTKDRIRLEIMHQDSSVEVITGTIVSQDDELILISDQNKETLTYRKIGD